MPIKITSKYTPLTYDEITKPLIQATEAQMAMETAYVDAQDKASAAMAKASQETDPIAYNRLKSYAEDLQAHADNLMRYGLQRGSRQGLMNLRRRYGEEISPIESAIQRREQLAAEQRKLMAANPRLRYQRDMSTTSLDEMLENPNLDYGRTIDLDDVSKRAATLVKAMGQGRTSVKYGQQLDRYTKEVLMSEGFTPEEIQSALSNDANADTALKAALTNLYASTGVGAFGDGTGEEVMNAIQQGAMMGAGEVKATIHADEEAKRRDAIADRAHSEAFQAALYGMYKDSDGNWAFDPNNPGPKTSGRLKADGSADGVKDSDFEIVPKMMNGEDAYRKKDDNSWWTKRNGKYYPIDASTALELQKQYVPAAVKADSRIRLQEEPLYFGGDDFDIIRENGSSFSPVRNDGKGTQVTVASLSAAARKKLMDTLHDYYPGIKITDPDLKIYKDTDPLSRNEYKVVLE